MIGKTVSHYKILEKLGEGGMGVVYKAKDLKLDRFVALKFLPPYLSSSEDKQRFIQEAKAASALDHPNICNIYEIDETEDGHMFISMAFYEGETLRKKIERGPLSPEQTIDIATHIAHGLVEAHKHDIIHRDIKPANIMITKDGMVKILDFGLAKVAEVKITKNGITMGTAAYLSPEQADGDPVDQRTDLWSLGVVLYEMLTGQLPFKGEVEQAIIYSILTKEPEPVTRFRTDLPSELEQTVNKCLTKELSGRYLHAGELIADLRLLQKEPTLQVIPYRKAVRTQPSRKRFKSLVVLGILFFVAIMVVTGYFFFFHKVESQERIPIAVVDFVNETDEKELNGLSGMLITALEQSRRLSVLTRSRMFDILKQLGKADVDRIDETLGREICQQANVKAMAIASIKKLGRIYTVDLKIFDLEKNEYLFTAREDGEGQESILSIIDILSEKTRREFKERASEIRAHSNKVIDVTTINLEAYQHYFKGEELINRLKFEEAQEEFKKAIALDPTFGLAYYRLAYAISWRTGREHLEKEPLQKALALIDNIPEKERYLVRAQNALLEKGYEAGIMVLKKMEQLYPNDKEMLYNIGDWSYHKGQRSTTAEYLEKVLIVDPTSERALQHLTWTYREMGHYEKMLEAAKHFVSIASSADSYSLLGEAYTRLGEFEAGLKYLRLTQELAPERWYITSLIADIYSFQGHYEKAVAESKKLIKDDQPHHIKRQGYARMLHLLHLGKYRETIGYVDKARELFCEAGDTTMVALMNIYKGILTILGWNDLNNAWKEAEKTLQLQIRISNRSNYWPIFSHLSVLLGDYELAESSIAKTNIEWFKQWTHSIIHSAKHECDTAESIADTLFVASPGFAWIPLLYHLAECQYEEGHFDKAVESLLQLQIVYHCGWAFRPMFYPKSFYLLGKIYEKKGDNQLAIENYEKLVDLWENADEDLSDLIDAKARLAKLK